MASKDCRTMSARDNRAQNIVCSTIGYDRLLTPGAADITDYPTDGLFFSADCTAVVILEQSSASTSYVVKGGSYYPMRAKRVISVTAGTVIAGWFYKPDGAA